MVAPVVDEKTLIAIDGSDGYLHTNPSRWASINPFNMELTSSGTPEFRVRDPGGTPGAWMQSGSISGNLVTDFSVPAVFGVTPGAVAESLETLLTDQGHTVKFRVTTPATEGATRTVSWAAGGQTGQWTTRTTGEAVSLWTEEMTRNIYNWHVTARGGTPVADTDTRFWSARPTLPTTGTVYASISELNTALAALPTSGTFRLADGDHNGTITVPSGCADITVSSETLHGARLTGNSRIVVSSGTTNVDVLGFSFRDMVRTLSGGFNPVNIQGTSPRLALCDFAGLTLDQSVGTATSVTRAASPISAPGTERDGKYIVTVAIANTNLGAGTGVPGTNGGRFIRLSGADQDEYNGTHLIRARTSTSITFYIDPSPLPATPATGTITVDYELSYQFPQFHWVVIGGSGSKARICFNNFEDHLYEGNFVRNADENLYMRVDHNRNLNKKGLPSSFGYSGAVDTSGVREEFQVGQNDSAERYYALFDNNWTQHFNFDASLPLSQPYYGDSDFELWTIKSSANCYLHNCVYQSCGRLNMRTANETTIYGNFFIGAGSAYTEGMYIRGTDPWVLFNMWIDCLVPKVWAPLSILAGNAGTTAGAYLPTETAVIANNTIYGSPYSIVVNDVAADPIVPGEIRANALHRTGTVSTVFYDTAIATLTGWTLADNVGVNSQGFTAGQFVNSQPALTRDSEVIVPTAAGNCDETGSLPSIIDVDECVDILGTDLSALSDFHVGAVQPGYTLSGNPWLAIYDEAGPG